MFIDETKITIKAGDGGDGCYSHLREKYRPKGGPDGGDGGRGGSIFMQGSTQKHTLMDISYHRSYKAQRGAHGKGSKRTGKRGEDITVFIPLGTVIYDDETGEILYDCVAADLQLLIASGGAGGKGNAALRNRNNPNPERAEPGLPGQERKLRLELKVLADVGLVGRPNAGKSTFLSIISKAHPKIADYPFTTTEPHLGIVKIENSYDSFVVADIPGLIEGSHLGKGLGIRFLRHIERTRILAIMVEATAEDPLQEAETLLHELRQYSPLLADKPKCFILTKTDLLPAQPDIPGWLPMSSVSRTGVIDVLRVLKKLIDGTKDSQY
jgi:GTP-binding protein